MPALDTLGQALGKPALAEVVVDNHNPEQLSLRANEQAIRRHILDQLLLHSRHLQVPFRRSLGK